MINSKCLILLYILLQTLYSCAQYKALFVMPSGSKSHINYYKGIIEALEQHGHEFTTISPYKLPRGSPSARHLLISDIRDDSIGNRFELKFFQQLSSLLYISEQCVKTLNNSQVQKLLKETYDYVIMPYIYADCFLGYVYEKKMLLVNVWANVLPSAICHRVGIPEFGSIYPTLLYPNLYPPSFLDRILVTILDMTGFLGTLGALDRSAENECRKLKLWSAEVPPMRELQRQASLHIINSFQQLEVPLKPSFPNVIHAGGIHIPPPRQLPQDLETWLNGSGKPGFILFSLGTAVKSSQMKQEQLQIILRVFKSLDQRIIWKWESEKIKNLPSNVKLSPWLPQQDILAHPNIRLFITHGGLLSTQEGLHYGVPMIGMPVFGDQEYNVARSLVEGWGRKVTWKELSEDTFRKVIQETLADHNLHQRLKNYSKFIRDWPRNTSQEIVYWTDYMIRHKGATHLRSPQLNMPWYQILNLDVWSFIILLLLAVFLLFYFVLKICLRCSPRLKRKAKKD